MHALYYETILALVAGVLSWSLIGLYRRAMSASRNLDVPNERSMHAAPIPVGAGVVIIATAILLWPVGQAISLGGSQLVLLVSLAGLAVVSWIDDRLSLSPLLRFSAQLLAVAVCLSSLPTEARALPFMMLPIERLLEAAAWLWFINLFNFMDGIDGLAGTEAIAIAVGYLFLLPIIGLDSPLRRLALIVAAAVAGYLVWNWHPAKVFMGDAGSVPLGFLLGWLMIDLSVHGHWPAAVILPLYFAADATFTLFKRMLSGQRPWQPHRQHFYQRAVLGGATPAAVVGRIGVVNAVLVVLALVSIRYWALALAAAAVIVAGLLVHLQNLEPGESNGGA